MTAARKTQAVLKNEARAALATRLDLLLRHAITINQFDLDVAQECKRDGEEIWAVLALLDQYHRLGKLPTELFRELKSSADRRGFERRGMPLPEVKREVAATISAPSPETAAPPAPPILPALPIPPVLPVLNPPTAVAKLAALPEVGVGRILAQRYLLEAELSSDQCGTMFQALDQRHTGLSGDAHRIAIQVLRGGDVAGAAVTLAEWRQEFRAAQPLSHPHIIRVHELDQDGACVFLTMDLVHGATLSALLARYQGKPMPRAIALAIIRDLGAALVYAHERGVVHGDLNPQCMVISAAGELRVRGFGSVRAHSNYASCEQLENRTADRRDDLYALACISYELLHGSPSFGLLNAATARGRALLPVRPILLTRTQWQTLRIGLAWRRENRTVGVAWWLAHMRLTRAAKRLPALDALAELQPLRRSLVRPLLLIGCLAAAMAAATALDRLPTHAILSEGWNEVRSATAATPRFLERLGNWLSPAAAPAIAPSLAAVRPAVAVKKPATQPRLPKPVRLALIDRPAAPQIELSTDNYTVLPGESAARVMVRRRGTLQGDVSFVWWTEEASARADRDYVDWGRRAEQIPAGHSSVTLLVPIVSDLARTESRVFYVALGTAGGGAALGDNARAAILMPGGK